MGFMEILTIVFVVLKLIGIIDWSWWLVLLPELIAVGFYLLWLMIVSVFTVATYKKISKS